MNKQSHILVGVVGAGTMGAGIALVALTAGYRVTVCDVQNEVLERAKSYISQSLKRSVEKARLTSGEMEEALARLQFSTELSALADAAMVVEAVPENLSLKRSVLQQLEQVCRENSILATNTSSLSITVLASQLAHRHRVVGLHFFNPAPVMRLIEIVVGEDTSQTVVEQVEAFARSFKKQTIVCHDTPGFVVNRVARNYYGEALKVVGAGGADYSTVDKLLEQAAGFRMGPFALMDLIGIDVNFDVTKSVYDAYHQESRFRPHRLQEQKVLAGHLGRKTGKGFYRYDEKSDQETKGVSPESAKATEKTSDLDIGGHSRRLTPVVIGDTAIAKALSVVIQNRFETADESLLFDGPVNPAYPEMVSARLEMLRAHLANHRSSTVIVSVAGDSMFHRQLLQTIENSIPDDVVILTSLHGPSASTQASWLKRPERLRGFSVMLSQGNSALALVRDWAMSPSTAEHQNSFQQSIESTRSEYGLGAVVEWSRPVQAQSQHDQVFESDEVDRNVQGLWSRLGFEPVLVRDGIGGVTMRILSMVLNEAEEVMYEGTASAADIDLGMRLGTNYPSGPINWLAAFGAATIWYTLSALWSETGDSRYKVSQGLVNGLLLERSRTRH
ncbi:3-hydroxyacyl-CoA dehydrogenase NAD-binding domain-containing protein [Alicyclobacillus mengziensis]|uniref:3-hydroxyacyl-CoA dehydrogenase n=1 Tax=Alicyclobacillus mengziensis TaxID=2931921 RepID=A0A9X7Z6W7_9BACL|nr:3-hydroxyacyl-CoA dehydrogenase NAD-binding domain-containing protein [Alicyclobacillus mengziensis]QSO46816.1 hypothetical protein JZ786_20655 [Alicyclobacillus mengziensis]